MDTGRIFVVATLIFATLVAILMFSGHTSVLPGGFSSQSLSPAYSIGTSTPVAVFQVANASTTATTTMEIGASARTKGTCIKMYRTDGSAVYLAVAAGATSLTITTTSCANVTGF